MTPRKGALIKKAKTVLSLSLITFAAVAIGSCDLILQAAVRAAGGANKEIIEFIFTAALNGSAGVTSDCTGAIDGAKITVMVPYGTNLTALVANYSTTGATVLVSSVVQESSVTANNFTNPVIYTVVAADKSTVDYTVRALPYPSSAKAIASFSFASPAVTGTINDGAKTIAVAVPYGTNLTSLVAKFATTGVSVKVGSIEQVNGTTANDFTNPVTYTVTAADGSTANYIVTVTVDLTLKAITSFSFVSPAVTGTINEAAKSISVTVPYHTSLTALVAIFSTTGESVRVGSIEQVSGITPNDFTNPVTYTVTAHDNSTASYIVNVTIAPPVWKVVGTAGFSARPVYEVLLAIDPSNTLYCLYVDDRTDQNGKLMKYAGGSWQLVGTIGAPGPVYEVSIAIDTLGTVYISYRDNTLGYARVRVIKYTGGSWHDVGNALGQGNAESTSVAIDQAGTPYVAFEDTSDGSGQAWRATVEKYDGANWQLLGAPGLGAGDTDTISLAIDSAGIPFVAFKDHNHDYKSTVMKYVSESWQVVGTAGFSSGLALDLSLAIDSADNPYVLFRDASNGYRATMMKYVGGSWQVVGTLGFTPSVARSPSMAFDSYNIPYVAFAPDPGRVSVMKYERGSWQLVGSGFSEGGAKDPSIAIDTSGNIYVAYLDEVHNEKVTVMRTE